MVTKRRSITNYLVTLIVILAVVLCCALAVGITQRAEGSEVQLSDDTGIVATSASGYEDFSSYTNQALPDKIDRSNIKQYVPVDKFNTDGTTVFNGRNYGFVIYSKTKTNHVLIFKEVYTPHADGGGYDVSLQIVYQNSFFKTGNTIINAGSPYDISLANVKFNNYLFDSQMDNNIVAGDYDSKTDKGVYYIQSRYDSELSYYNGDQTAIDVIAATTSIISLAAAVVFPPVGVPLAATAASLLVAEASFCASALNGVGDVWLDTTHAGVALDFPLTRQGQIDTYGGLRKNITLDMKDGANEYMGQSGEYATASFRVMNDNNDDYYVYNNISFDICRYSGIEHHNVDTGEIESVYSVTGTTCNQYGQMTENDETFEFQSYQRFSPVAKTYLFDFKPDQAGVYNIYVPNGYKLVVDNTVTSNHKITVGAEGCKIGIYQDNVQSDLSGVYTRLLPQDFYGGEVAFTNITIIKDQELKVNEPTQVGELAYTVVADKTVNNDLFSAYVGDSIDDVDLYITDGYLNILAKAVKKDGSLYVNYPMKGSNAYGLICVNRSGAPIDLTVVREGGMTVEDHHLGYIEGLYYSYYPKYTQFFNTTCAQLFDEDMYSYSSENAFLQAGQPYFLRAQGEGILDIVLSNQTLFNIGSIDDVYVSQNTFNEIFNFTPIISARYQFDDGSYDIYDGNALVAQNASACVMSKDVTYLIVKRQFGGQTKIYLDGETLTDGVNSIDSGDYGVYTLNVDERSRLDISIDNQGSISIYDKALNEIKLDHGYLLDAGSYYVIIKDSGAYNITIEEYIQEVSVTLYVDGTLYNDTNKYYYGKVATFPVPTKDRHDFNGWKLNGELVTDSQGVMHSELLADELTLVADWNLRGIVMQINMLNGTSKWWTGEEMLPQQPDEVYIEGTMLNLLVNLKKDFIEMTDSNKQGYFLDTFEYTKTKSLGIVDYYEFTPVWQVEKYYIEFIAPYGTYSTTRAVTYSEVISQTVYPTQAFKFDKNQELYYLVGWQISGNSSVINFVVGNAQIDLTPNYGSEYNYDTNGDGKFDSTLVRLSSAVEYVDYTVRINGTSHSVSHDNGYSIGTLESHGYTASNYYGHNVLLKTSDGSKIFSFGSTIKVNDLTSYWRSDSKAVTVDLTLVDNRITVALTYNYSGSGNPTSYVDTQGNVTLKPAYVRTYKFNYWTVDGNRIDTLNYANLGIKQYYSVVSGVTLSKTLNGNFTRDSIKPTSGGSYTISSAAMYVDLSRFSIMTGMTFTITSAAEEVTFVNGKTCTDTQIVINSRSTKLVLNFDSVSMKAKSNNSVIDASSCPDLEIYSYNNVTLSAGEVNDEESYAAILCQNLTLLGSNIYINGGNQVAGYLISSSVLKSSHATAGIKAVSSNKTLTVSASNVTVQGGKGMMPIVLITAKDGTATGENGEDGCYGFNGGDGAVAIYFPGTVVLTAGSKLTCTGGAGGDGGNGGKGGNGGPGNGITVKAPGNGGNGGAGGNGGDGGKAIVYNSYNGTFDKAYFNPVAGAGGAGGQGGEGGAPGDPVTTILGKKSGSTGAKGKDGNPGTAGASTLA